jgi:glycerophosphoryl diester phosphodiesterase
MPERHGDVGRATPVLPWALGAAGVVAGTLGLIAPRVDAEVDRSWEDLARYRYAHRGLHDLALGIPENSLSAFRRARELGFGSELDVHLAADGRLVVVHDSDLARVTGRQGLVEDLTSEELSDLRLCGTDERIPAFDEVLDVYDAAPGEPAPPLVIELKCAKGDHAELASRAMAMLDAHSCRYCVESFDPRPLAWLRRHRPEVVRGQLAEDFMRDPSSAGLGVPARLGLSALVTDVSSRPDFIAYRFEHRRHPAMRLACGPLGGHKVLWTIRSERDMYEAESEGAVPIFEGFVPKRPTSY